jgi:hypothetical protein
LMKKINCKRVNDNQEDKRERNKMSELTSTNGHTVIHEA